MLSEVELQQMCDEMASKFSRLSEELLTNLQQRDVLAGEMEAKNRCVRKYHPSIGPHTLCISRLKNTLSGFIQGAGDIFQIITPSNLASVSRPSLIHVIIVHVFVRGRETVDLKMRTIMCNREGLGTEATTEVRPPC